MKRAFLFSALATLLVPASLRAQDVEREATRPARETGEQRRASRAAVESAKNVAPADGEVAYEQVLKDPDNVDLNVRYALGQIRRGELKGAASTLERVLLVNPNIPRARLLYAVVLFRLDNLAEARRELTTLKGTSLPAAMQTEVAQYLKEIDKRSKKTQLSGRLGVGWAYDDNRNAAPSTGERLFGGTPLTLTGDSRRREDTSLLVMANAEARRDLGLAAGHEAFAGFNYFLAEQTNVKTLNLKAYSFNLGGVYKRGRWGVTPQALLDHVQLAQATFLRNRGASVRVDRRLSKGLALYGELKDVYQSYSRTRDVPTAEERSGNQIDVALGADCVLNPKMKLMGSFGQTVKNAAKSYNAFHRTELALSHAWLLGKGAFLLSGLTYRNDRYNDPDTVISPDKRTDNTLRLSATAGAPLALAHAKLKDLMATFTYEYYHALSNLRNYAYTNNKVMLMLTYRWEAGL